MSRSDVPALWLTAFLVGYQAGLDMQGLRDGEPDLAGRVRQLGVPGLPRLAGLGRGGSAGARCLAGRPAAA